MNIVRISIAAAAVVGIALTVPAGGAVARPAVSGDDAVGVSAKGWQTEVRVGDPLPVPSVVAPQAPEASARSARAVGITVTYVGFSSPARAAFQRAVDIWRTKLTSPVPITIQARFEPLGTGVLGSAGSSNIWRDFRGAPQPGTWYVDAVANKRFGGQLSSSPDVVARFNSTLPNWHYGTGPAPAGRVDFTSVVLHEIGHGVGFLGAGRVSGGTGSVRVSGYPIAYDRWTENASGIKLLSLRDNSAQLATALTSNNVVIDTQAVRNANRGAPARLYAPSTWRQGSSYSHFNEATYPAGDPNSLMTPQISSGETIRNVSPLTLAVLAAAGW